jgi:hypothetical protein
LKIKAAKAVKSDPENGQNDGKNSGTVGKIRPCERIYSRKKIPVWWEISLKGRENIFRYIEPLV